MSISIQTLSYSFNYPIFSFHYRKVIMFSKPKLSYQTYLGMPQTHRQAFPESPAPYSSQLYQTPLELSMTLPRQQTIILGDPYLPSVNYGKIQKMCVSNVWKRCTLTMYTSLGIRFILIPSSYYEILTQSDPV